MSDTPRSYEGSTMPVPGNPNVRRVVAGIGRPKPPESGIVDDLTKMAGAGNGSPLSASMLQFLTPDAPVWAIQLMEAVKSTETSVASLKLALIRRGLLTQVEVNEATAVLQREVENQLRTMIDGMQREMIAMPPTVPGSDPRRPPSIGNSQP